VKIIYRPKGPAAEYAELALNYYRGCTHGCLYCYGPGASRTGKEKYHAGANPKENIMLRLVSDCHALSKLPDCPEILLSFLGDPYQIDEMRTGLTRTIIKTLIDFDLPFTILTKGGTRIQRDFDILEGYDRFRFGTSLSWFCDTHQAREWEPKAARVEDRINAIHQAHTLGIPTWISMEPIINPNHAYELIKRIHPWVDHWKIGKLNHNSIVEAIIDWVRFRDNVTRLLDDLGADYYIKDSLKGGHYGHGDG